LAQLIGNSGLYLKQLDHERITISERIEAMTMHGPKNIKGMIGQIQWDLSFTATPEVSGSLIPFLLLRRSLLIIHVTAMSSWQPAQLVMLALPKQGLTYFNVDGLVNLEYLDLSNNMIREIRGIGLEKCHALQHLNLKRNQIQRRENLKAFGFLPCLQYLMLRGNPVTKLSDYRLAGI